MFLGLEMTSYISLLWEKQSNVKAGSNKCGYNINLDKHYLKAALNYKAI